MTETLNLIIGLILLLLVMYDFFFTTLSGSGAGFITHFFAAISHKINLLLGKAFGRWIFKYSGLFVNLTVLAVWVFMAWAGLYFIYSSDPDAIVTNDGRVANTWERLYHTGYTLSTLGIGDFKPNTPVFQILTSFFSFFGFIFFTSSMTYLISVANALVNKRALTRSIQNLGKSPEGIAQTFLELDTSYSYQQILSLQEMVDKLYVNHQAYPVLHYFNHPSPKVALSVNFGRLDEAVTILLTAPKAQDIQKEVRLLQNSLTNFLNLINESYSRTNPQNEGPASSLQLSYEKELVGNEGLDHRRIILKGYLHSENFKWTDVISGS